MSAVIGRGYVMFFGIYFWMCSEFSSQKVAQVKRVVLCFPGGSHCSWLMAGVHHPCQHSGFSSVMKRSTKSPSLIMAENLKWAWMTLPETHHSITEGYVSPGVVYCRSRTLQAARNSVCWEDVAFNWSHFLLKMYLVKVACFQQNQHSHLQSSTGNPSEVLWV